MIYRVLRHLSIDVAIGAAAMMWMCATWFAVQIDGVYYLLLSLFTWLIYATDHLMDARNIKHEASTPRHRFHQKHYKSILTAVVAGTFLIIALIPRHVEEGLFRIGLILLGLILLYFLSLIWARKKRFRWVLKELFIAFCYTLGISLVPVYAQWPPATQDWVFLSRIFCLALCNLFLFSWMEAHPDAQDQHPSAITFMGQDNLRNVLRALLWLNLLAGIPALICLNPEFWVWSICISVMNLLLLLITSFPDRFRRNETYRVLGDGIFLIPGVVGLIMKLMP